MSSASKIESALSAWLTEGRRQIGQVAIASDPAGGFLLTHVDDSSLPDLTDCPDPVEIAREDDAFRFRPLKASPTLRHGWRHRAPDLSSLCLALEAIYPGRLRAYLQHTASALPITPLRETLARQTGMYRVTARLSDAQAESVINRLCRVGCLRVPLWNGASIPSAPDVIPLLCQEACNLFIAEARAEIKGATPKA